MNRDNNPRSRCFNLLLYPDDPTHNFLILQLMAGNYDCAYCLHDKDTYLFDTGEHKAGELKKAHYHVVIEFPNKKYLNALAEELGIEKNYIQKTDSFKGSLKYLIHYGDETKYQYDFDEVQGSLKSRLARYLKEFKPTYGEDLYVIYNFIDNYNQYARLRMSEVIRFCNDNNMDATLTRGYRIINDYVLERNQFYGK